MTAQSLSTVATSTMIDDHSVDTTYFPSAKVATFIRDARSLILKAEESEADDAGMELFQAALRLAGAVIESRYVGRKRRPKGNTWELLAKVDSEWFAWSVRMRSYSHHYRDWAAGLRTPSKGELEVLRGQVLSFYADVVEHFAQLPAAA